MYGSNPSLPKDIELVRRLRQTLGERQRQINGVHGFGQNQEFSVAGTGSPDFCPGIGQSEIVSGLLFGANVDGFLVVAVDSDLKSGSVLTLTHEKCHWKEDAGFG